MIMASIIPDSELVRRAAAWICEQREAAPEKSPHALLDEAGMRFNLSPKDQRMLADLFTQTTRLCDLPGHGRPD